MRKFKHLTLRYVLDRVKLKVYTIFKHNNPWLTSESIKLIEDYLDKKHVVMEFGSGRSTSWFTSKVSKIISIESDPTWYKKISSELNDKILKNELEILLILSKIELLKFIDNIEENSLDFVLVDSRYNRNIISLKILDKLKISGMLVVDDISRYIPCEQSLSPNARKTIDGCADDIWVNFMKKTSKWRYTFTTNNITDTGIFIKT